MKRRCLVHAVLSLLLLVSQQMAFAHAMSHWTAKLGSSSAVTALVQDGLDKDLSSSVAQDASCSQCLAFAQTAFAIGGTPHQFIPLDLSSPGVRALVAGEATPRTVCVFRSRAPPSFV